MTWWLQNNLRMIQNNIRDIDAAMDVDRHVATLQSFGANVAQIGCGGITAFHPSKLECQRVSPYMKGDFFGEFLAKCHASGIRVIARFDFSKTHESFYDSHPEWHSRRADGSPVRYNDTVATCVNGEYQRRLSLEIIGEVIRKYPVDGIFFNMIGYITSDYSGNRVGICQCESCRARFREMYGEKLPSDGDAPGAAVAKYGEFKKKTVAQQLLGIRALVRSVSPDIAISTYAFPGVDIVRDESNSALDRPLPFWIYSSTDNVGVVEGSCSDRISSNCAINAVDIPYRFMAVSAQLNRLRLYGNMAAGSGLDWCIIGGFEGYPDCENMESVRKIFHFHKLHESLYGNFDPRTRILLVRGVERHGRLNREYRGIFRMLKEEHILFTVIDADALESHAASFDAHDFIFLPGIAGVSGNVAEALRRTSACVIASGSGVFAERSGAVAAIFGVEPGEEIRNVRGTYVRTAPEEAFPGFAKKRWVFLEPPYRRMTLGQSAAGLLPKVEAAMFGPPERCFGHVETADEWMAALANGNLFLPWNIGALYYQYGYDEFKRLLLDMMRHVRPIPRAFETNAPEMVEMFLAPCGGGAHMLQLINLTGFNGMTFFEPPAIADIEVRLTDIAPAEIHELTETGLQPVSPSRCLHISLRKGELYKAFLLRS